MTEIYKAEMNTSWKNFDYYGTGKEILNDEFAGTDDVHSDYSLTTPLKFSTGVAYISKFGLITADVDFVNPANAKYSSNVTGVSFDNENNNIKETFSSAINYRIGGEYRYKIWRVRAGYGVQGSTYNSDFDYDNSIRTISGGVGIRIKKFYADFAYVNTSGKSNYQPYSFFNEPGPIADLKRTVSTGMITFGFTF
jgi:hypothetical protein